MPNPEEGGPVPALEVRGVFPNCCPALTIDGGKGGLKLGTGGITLGCPLGLAGALAGIGAGRETEGGRAEGALLGPYRLRLNSG